MKVKLIGKNSIISLTLPENVYGNYWIANEEKENIINIEASDNSWVIKSNAEVKIINGNEVIERVKLALNSFYTFLNINTNEKYRIFVCENYYDKMIKLKIKQNDIFDFCIGNSSKSEGGKPNYISYDNANIFYNQLEISYANGIYFLKNLHPEVNVYVNNNLVTDTYFKFGDIIFIEGFSFSFVGKTLLLNPVDNKIRYATEVFEAYDNPKLDYTMIKNISDGNLEMYDKKDYFLRPPRFSEIIETKEISVDSPPAKQELETLPVILTLGPMLVMGMGSSVSGALALIRVISGEAALKDNIASIITAFCMLTAMLIFPSISKAYQKRRNKKKEKLRQEKYKEYLLSIDAQMKEECIRQKRILEENNVDLKNTGDIILYRKRNLWERKVFHQDFLELRLGMGNVPPKIKVNYQKEHFKVVEDNLEQELLKVIDDNKLITDVPVTLSFREKYVNALIGKYSILRRYVDGLILQMMALHSYEELKIVIFTNNANEIYWDKLKNTPYTWKDDKTIRYYGTKADDIVRISAELEEIFRSRNTEEDDQKAKIYAPHFMIITDDVALTSKVGIVNDILKSNKGKGFSLLYLTEKLNSLPSECSSFISIDTTIGGIFENELVNKKQEFVPDFTMTTINSYIYSASNIPVDFGTARFELPNIYTFMEMYDAGNVEQLNSYNRWKQNDPTTSLACPIGINENGELFNLDLHEKVHGPHGLVAGMTGSGKSELIITYILSMAVNYDPREVQFVIIDYKGGGLAGAFENSETGVKLPHLAGTITNLDVNGINRSLSSLQSELKRRQRVFNEARDKCNESTIDIYKYQKLYREGKVEEPVAHLLIISDEFAELKSQQPEFMAELISTARIGRSLGVHLILATQKPSGVVDDQIWSNSRFRICLKVQDKSDSNDMIRSPEAAYIKETGRFVLQVGFNEFFAKGQSAWCGASYYETEKRKKIVDTEINFIDNIGSRIKSIDSDKTELRGLHKGEELINILNYIVKIGQTENVHVKQLWLDAISANVYVDNLKKKYGYIKENYIINPIFGEYDAPKEQRQNLLTLPLTRNGNTIIYGSVGSGKENLVSTIIYSLITTYTVDEINVYVLDFGAEALKMYAKAPQVGGVVGSGDSDKLATLMKMLHEKMDERKKLFAEYNGSYLHYCQNSGSTMPSLVIAINGFESFNELYPEFADELILLTREGAKYGILFILTVSATNNIRMKLSQNFPEKIVLQMNDEFDYRQILGRTEVVPSKILGRGLIKREDIYEFQSAYPVELNNLSKYINDVITNLNNKTDKRAATIPTLPEIVTTSFVSSHLKGLYQVPIGVNKESLDIISVDVQNQPSLLITGQNIREAKSFINSFIYELSILKDSNVYVIDAEKILNDRIQNVKYFNTSFEKVFSEFKTIVDNINDIYVKSDYDSASLNKYGDMVFIIIGINKIKTILGSKFDELLGNPISTSKKLSKMSYVLIDNVDSLKKLEYDLWYKDIVNSTRGIWIGDGLAEQSLFKLLSSTRNISNDIPNNFGYNIVSGIPSLFKYIENYDAEDKL